MLSVILSSALSSSEASGQRIPQPTLPSQPKTSQLPTSQPATSQPLSAQLGTSPPTRSLSRSYHDVAHAPSPEAGSGLAVPEESNIGEGLLWIPRVILFIPRIALELAFAPLRELSYAWERFQIPQRFKQVFFNDKGTFGIFPVAFVDTGFGLNAGVRLIHRNLFGRGEKLLLRASFGGRFEQFYSASINTGNYLGRFTINLVSGYERGPRDPFYGIGNGDEVSIETIKGLIDAQNDDTAVATQFEHDLLYVKLSLGVRLTHWLSLALTSKLRFQWFDQKGHDDDINNIYNSSSLVGFVKGTSDVFTQLKLVFDNRRAANDYMPQALFSKGFCFAGWLGYAKGFDDDPSNYLRYSLDLWWLIHLFRGDRVLVLRLLLDGVTANVDKIPFTDLPELGGTLLLRGYNFDRFRDRVITTGSIEYQYNLTFTNTAFFFVDTGRVWRSLGDFRFKNFRMGFGGGIIFHSHTSILARIQFSSSIDGGFLLNFGLDPV